MLKTDRAVHPAIYKDVARNHVLTPGQTLGEIEDAIDENYRKKIDAYGLSDGGYFIGDGIAKDKDKKEIDDFFNEKFETGKRHGY